MSTIGDMFLAEKGTPKGKQYTHGDVVCLLNELAERLNNPEEPKPIIDQVRDQRRTALRDDFAGRAAAGLLQGRSIARLEKPDSDLYLKRLAAIGYKVADALLAEKRKRAGIPVPPKNVTS